MDKNFNIFAKAGFILCCIAVALGAFASHYLNSKISSTDLITFDTGTKYMLYHGFAISLLSINYKKFNNDALLITLVLFLIGIPLFTGSLYALVIGKLFSIAEIKWLMVATPIGGASLIFGWLYIAFKGFNRVKVNKIDSTGISERRRSSSISSSRRSESERKSSSASE